jgi:uncharacterized lipoprotein YddW (UPF0748 family)
MRKNYSFLALLLFLLFISCGGSSGSSTDDNGGTTGGGGSSTSSSYFSGTWVTNVASDVLKSKAGIQACVDNCKKYGINNIFMVVWNKGVTMYPSSVMKNTFGIEQDATYSGRDPLAEMITAAHQSNIKVYAWFEYGFACSYGANGGEIIKQKPGWAGKDSSGNLLNDNGFDWMNAFLPEVQDFMISLVKEVVTNYDIDGVMGDDRLPACPSTGGYDDYTVNLYKQENGNAAPPADAKNTAWVQWRADKLTDFMKRLYTAVKAVKSTVEVVSTPGVYTWCKVNYLQDWPTWLSKGYVDKVIPQLYRYNISDYKSLLTQQIGYVSAANKSKFYPALLIQNGSYNPTLDFLKQMIEADRSNSITSECFWFYEGLPKFDAYFQTYKKK